MKINKVLCAAVLSCMAALASFAAEPTFVSGPYYIQNHYTGFGYQYLYDTTDGNNFTGAEDGNNGSDNTSYANYGRVLRIVSSSDMSSTIRTDSKYLWDVYSYEVGGMSYYMIRNKATGRYMHTGAYGDYLQAWGDNNSLNVYAWNDGLVNGANGLNSNSQQNREISYYCFDLSGFDYATFTSEIENKRFVWGSRPLHGQIEGDLNTTERKGRVFFTNNDYGWDTKNWVFNYTGTSTQGVSIVAQGGKKAVCPTGGSFVSLRVNANIEGEEISYAWKKDGQPYSTGKGATWNNIRPAVAGEYTCEVTADGVTYTSNAIAVTNSNDVCPNKTFETYLPIVLVNTNGQGFPSDCVQKAGIGPSIKAKRTVDVKVIWHEDGSLNSVTQTADTAALHYDRKAIMNHRGSTSADMIKKPFAFRTCKKNLEDGTAKKGNFAMLNMLEEKDWILYASYGDKSLMRNKLAMDLYYMMGYWQTDLKFVELFIDGNYRGVYLMMEKITHDKNRVSVTKDGDTNTDPKACGYIWKLDKTDGGNTTWARTTNNCGGSCGVGGCGNQSYYQPQRYELVYPEDDALNYGEKLEYIKGQVSNFEKALNAANDEASFRNVFENYIDLQSFADYFIIAELAKCSDAYRVSVFFTKDVNGKIRLTPIWDFDMGFGNSTTHGSFDPYTWQYNANGVNETNFPIPFWWNKLRTSSCFNSVVRTRWHELRQAFFSNESIMARIDDMYNLIGKDLNGVGGTSPSSRNKSRWSWNTINDCGGYDCPWHIPSWPNDYPSGGKTTSLGSQEIPNMKEWITRRLAWLDSQIDNDAFGSLLNDISSCTNQEETEPHCRTDIEEIAENGEINISAQDGVLSIEALTEGDEIENVEIVSVNGSVLFAAKAIKSQNYQVEVPQTGVFIVKVQTQMSSVTKMMFVE